MAKLVYLHALDSVRNSPREIAHGREALFQEIVLNGNIPVISFNQLTDSHAFLGLVMQSEQMLEAIKILMRNGRIRISRYSDKRTASQYLQDVLDPQTHSKKNQFVLSGWDLPQPSSRDACGEDDCRELIESIYHALKNNEPSYVLRHSDDEKDRRAAGFASETTPVNETQRESMLRYPHVGLERIVRLIKLVQFISANDATNATYVAANQNSAPQFLDFMDRVLSYASAAHQDMQGQSNSPLEDPELLEAFRMLSTIRKEVGGSLSKPQARSSWYNALYNKALHRKQHGGETRYTAAEKRAFQVIDMCYNFTVEASISRASIHYDPTLTIEDGGFLGELQERIVAYEKLYSRFNHVYYQGPQGTDSVNSDCYHVNSSEDVIVRKWHLAGCVVDAVVQRTSRKRRAKKSDPDKEDIISSNSGSKSETESIELYEFHQTEQRKSWRKKVYLSLLKQISVFVLYVLVFAGLEISTSLVQDMFNANAGSEMGLADMLSPRGSFGTLALFIVGIVLYCILSKRLKGVALPFIGILSVYLIVLPSLVYIDALVSRPEEVSNVFIFFTDTLQAMLPTIIVTFVSILIFGIFGAIVESNTKLPGLFESVLLLAPSAKSLAKFAATGKRTVVSFSNPLTARGIKTGVCAGSIDPRSDLWREFGVNQQDTLRGQEGNKQWSEYIDWHDVHDAGRADGLKIVDDFQRIHDFEWEEGKRIGIRYESPYHKLVVDLVEDNGHQFAYERLVPAQEGAVVIVALHHGDFVLLDQYRHAIGDRQICFPRGFGEPNISPVANACKELGEETGIHAVEADMTLLGYVTPDSGVQGTRVAVFACETNEEPTYVTSEQIREIRRISPEDFAGMIEHGEIEDGFTLSAYTLWRAKQTLKSY